MVCSGAEDSGSQCILEKIVKKKVEEEEEEESAEEPEQSTSLDEEDLSDPDYQLTNTRFKYNMMLPHNTFPWE